MATGTPSIAEAPSGAISRSSTLSSGHSATPCFASSRIVVAEVVEARSRRVLAPAAQGQPVEGTVIRVVDGDTIYVKLADRVEKIRYIGMNTPEIHHPTKRQEPGALREATARGPRRRPRPLARHLVSRPRSSVNDHAPPEATGGCGRG